MNSTNKRKQKRLRKPVKLMLSLLVLVCVSVGGTLAYLKSTASVNNTFTVGDVDTTVDETFENNVKSNVTATNTGNVPAFIRIKMVTYRVNANNEKIGGNAVIPEFELGDDWFEFNGFYYYSKPVQPGYKPGATDKTSIGTPLIGTSGIILAGNYPDSDGGKQVIEVIAEAIQASPTDAVTEAWGLECDKYGNLIDPSSIISNEEVQS